MENNQKTTFKTVTLHLQQSLKYVIKKEKFNKKDFSNFKLEEPSFYDEKTFPYKLDNDDSLYVLSTNISLKDLNSKPEELIKEFIPAGTLIPLEDIETENKLTDSEVLTVLNKGTYALTQGVGTEINTIFKAAYEQWLNSLWDEKPILDETFYLRILKEEGFPVFQIIRPLKII